MAEAPATHKRRARAGTIQRIEQNPDHHLFGAFRPQTPFDQVSAPPTPTTAKKPLPGEKPSPMARAFTHESQGLWNDVKTLRWAIVPSSALKLLLIPLVLWANWEIVRQLVGTDAPNPFRPIIFISHRIPDSPPEAPLYQKGYLDLVFIAYWILVWSFFRQFITLYIARPMAHAHGIRKEGKIDRFGEQAYAIIYFGFTGAWGIRIMSQLPTWWYNTESFWINYPHWQMIPELKAYYLMQAAYWCQQLLVLILGLEKPRVDYYELVAHHFVTLWLVGWSYLINLTFIGSAIYLSMDIPDMFLALSKIFNYMQWNRTKMFTYAWFMLIWTYFRHYLNIKIMYSVLTEFDLMPDYAKEWSPKDGWWMVWWMKYQIFVPICALQIIQLFWYWFMWRIAYRAVFFDGTNTTDARSDDEDDGDDDVDKED